MTDKSDRKKQQPPRREKIAEALGAARVVPLERLPSQGPLDLMELKAEVGARLRSSGGRPTDPDWDIRRLVPFRSEDWQELERLSELCQQEGQSVSPSQLAALLIERGVDDLKKSFSH